MRTHQLNTRINANAYAELENLSKKLHTTKAHLTEKAIYLLKDQFEKLEKSSGESQAPDIFLSLLSKSMDQYDLLYKKLAK